MFNYTKGLAPVVATALILVISVLFVVNFESFYSSFESSVVADLNDNSNSISSLQVQGVFDNYLYLNSDLSSDVEILKILSKNGSVMCDYNKGFDNSGLVGWWSFENSYNNNFSDDSGIGGDGIITNASISNSILGRGLLFDSTPEYAKVDFNSNLKNLSGNIGIFSWIKTKNNTNSEMAIIRQRTATVNRSFEFYLNGGELFFLHGNGVIPEYLDSNYYVADNNWHYVGFIANYPNYTFYVDGVNVNSGIMAFDIVGNLNSLGVFIGGEYFTWISFPWIQFDGMIDEPRIYNTSLSNNEIENLYYFNSPSLNITKGINQIGVPGCRLESGKSYDILIKTSNSNLFESTITVK